LQRLAPFLLLFALFVGAASAHAQEYNPETAYSTFRKVCGVCHATDFSMPPRSKDQWTQTIQKMQGLGAKGSPDEFALIIEYLMRREGSVKGGGRGVQAGSADKHLVDFAAAERGRKVWAAECINCHGTQARGGPQGANLVRSEMVLHDRYGSEIIPYLKKGHPLQSGHPISSLTGENLSDVVHFIHEQVYDTLRGSPIFHQQDLLTGDAKAGAAFFNGAGGCTACHSVTGDLAKIGAKYDVPALELRIVSPRNARGPNRPRVTITVTAAGAPPVTGYPAAFDDFTVALRDAQGVYHSWARTPDVKVVKNDPFAAHDALLDKYTDKDMHDLLAYLVTLK